MRQLCSGCLMYYWGKAVGRFEQGLEARSCRSRDAGSRLGHGERGFKSISSSPISEVFFSSSSSCFDIYRAEKRLYPHCSSWMYPHHLHQPCCPLRDRSKPMSMWCALLIDRLGDQPNPEIKSQISQWSKASGVHQSRQDTRGFAPRLLCMGSQGCTFLQFHYAAGKKKTLWKKQKTKQESLGMEWFFQCIVTIIFFCLILV